MPFSGILLKIYHTYAKNTSASRFLFVKSITHIRPKKLSAALFLQQRAFLCFMLLSCLSLVDRCDINQGQLLHICIFQTGYECGCGIQRGQYVDTCLDRVPADDESVFGVLNTLGTEYR